ncbi:ATP-grasp domain-containing protein [Saezia sanguinis]|uniref:ATP-grasp domain-containing protein n=1 Tax=Saezia sanguinis TaxID=1965230 RepID=UPI0030D9ED7E
MPAYQADDIAQGLQLAQTVASRLNVPFLVVDIAKTADGRWIVIECNDAQESGYTGIQPQLLWRRILEHGIPVLQD